MTRLIVLILVFVASTGWSTLLTLEHGFWGFLEVPKAGGWSSQVFVDLCLALIMTLGGMRKDAREQGILFWPYAVGTVLLGSIAPLAYLVHRQARKLRAQ